MHTIRDVRLILTTADGRSGTQWLRPPKGQEEPTPMIWSADGDDETISAHFGEFEFGKLVNEYEIDGDDWRALEDSGELPYVWIWVRRGYGLSTAVDCSVDACDPPGAMNDYEQSIEERNETIAKLRSMVKELAVYANKARTKLGLALYEEASRLYLDSTPYTDQLDVIQLAQQRDPTVKTFKGAIARFGTSLLQELEDA